MDEATLKSIASQLRKPQGDEGRQMAERMNVSNALINQWTVEQLAIAPNDRILEIGMGNGLFVKDILDSDLSLSYTGFDYSETMVEEATRRNKEFAQHGRAHFIQGTVDALPFPNNSFDKIFAVNVIYFWDTPEKELSEIRRTIKPNGVLALGIRPQSTMKYYPFAKYGFIQYSKESLTALLSQNGFEVIDALERREPEMDLAEEKMQAVSLIVTAKKTS